MTKRLLVGFLFGTLATIGLAAQTKIAMCPQSGALSVYTGMAAGGCSVGTLTFSNFSYSYTQIAGTTTTNAPSNYNLSPYTGPNGTGLAVDAPLQTGGANITGEIFTLAFDVSPNNGTAINGLGFIVNGLSSDASASVSIQGPVFPEFGRLAASCQNSDIGQTCFPQSQCDFGGAVCPPIVQHQIVTPMPSGNVNVEEMAYAGPPGTPGALGPLAVTFDETPLITPEPATWLLFGTGLLLMLGLVARARRKERIAD